jgi:Xaa-Pro aminopeptidase/Xaa-Pro dipeptidase
MEPFYQSRKIKDGNEIKIIADAAKILDKLFTVCKKTIRVGVTEKQLQATLLYEAVKREAYPPSYKYTLSPLIIASGINSALPHAAPTDRKVRKGDLITVDLTLRHKGYIADATRTFALGRINADMKKVYDVVKEAQEAGLDAAKTGATCGEVDNACRSLIERKGYGKYFIHSTGHGIGLEVHEPPWVKAKNEEVLEKNTAITVEPGIYIPDKFGVRIEDSIIVNKKAKILNKFTKELLAL